ncbi:cytochrome p450 [Moniliophthora roreri MCA 2997]|uniref:Cytochrome p450 n=1 Tax=Moniliophthora roreri (strain MCA 2997) TaxID=1381753 RepID=V2WN15_MONRO|nr:cytochrome p450 [Moniliophthora roreri MCA 2997]
MALNITASLCCALIAFFVWTQLPDTRRKMRLPPGPKGYPIVGNLFQLDSSRPWHTFVEWQKTYGDIVHLRLFNQNIILLNSAKAAGDLLDDRAIKYSQRPRSIVADYMTGGMLLVFLNLGTRWRAMRRAAHEALSVRAIARYHPILMRGGIRLAMGILKSPEECHNHVQRFTSSDIAAFLYNNPSQETVIPFLASFVDLISEAVLPGAYLANHIPLLEYVPDFLAKWKRESKEIFRVHSARFLDYFLNVKEELSKKQEVGPSFCAMLVETHEQHGLDDVESSWLAAMIYLAGYETIAGAIDWLILAMIRFPEAQRKAQEELDNVVGHARLPTLEDMENLPYMRAVVKETLRWRPTTPLGVLHAALEDDTYEGYFIPKDSLIIPNVLAMNHDADTYGPNPEEFRPERFLNEDGTEKPSPPNTKEEGHYTFGFGRRTCPGRHLAFNTMLSLAIVLWAMHLERGKDEFGVVEPLSTDDEASGVLSRARPYKVSSKPRFPEALELLTLAKEEWL